MTTRTLLIPLLEFLILSPFTRATEPARFSISHDDAAVTIKHFDGKELLRYNLRRPEGTRLSVDTGCFFHPLATPTGLVVTEVGPADHPHHRGVFLAWVEMHGQKDADFWGWGEHAPTKDRRIVNREVPTVSAKNGAVGFTARNEWTAEGTRILTEQLAASLHTAPPATVLDLTYTLTPDADLTLTRWAFSGFCVRTRKDGKLQAFSPKGLIDLPNPSHVKPDSDWSDQPWYDYTLTLDDGRTAGVAVLNHPRNPPTLWHNHRDLRMLNPCIVAPAEVKLQANKPLTLRYRVLAHDGPTPTDILNKLAADWK
jgi:hypothetical protein